MNDNIATKISDGVVIIRNMLKMDDQQCLVNIVSKFGNLFDANGKPNFSSSRSLAFRFFWENNSQKLERAIIQILMFMVNLISST